ncbi:MAG: hypothetical protein PF692_06755 [Kiritimatiellae bacterium]|jgi:hypothetical protein|nr:hypothetical protein [Kiritimatiellia bacterium]
MGYNKNNWKMRLSERSDLSSQVVHLTRENDSSEKTSITNILYEIVSSGVIKGSNTESGFICGDTPAVCFQDAPLHAICQNVYFEEKFQNTNPNIKTRYRAVGLAFPKDYVYRSGGRPVIYEKTNDAKLLLPVSEWWRIVNFDLDDSDNFIDWTHEREWRVPNDFEFEIEKATLLFVTESIYKTFISQCEANNTDYFKRAKGVVVMDNLLY